MAIEKELLDQLLEGRDPETVFTRDGLLDELKKGLSERVLNAELDAHLDTETADGKANRRNGRSQKTVLTGTSKVTLGVYPIVCVSDAVGDMVSGLTPLILRRAC